MDAKQTFGDVLKSLRARFGALDSTKRSNLVKFGVVGIGAVLLLIAYYGSGKNDKPPPRQKQTVATIELGDSRLEDDIRAQVEREREEARNVNAKQDVSLEKQREALDAQAQQIEIMTQALKAMESGGKPPTMPSSNSSEPGAGSGSEDPLKWANASGPSGTGLRPPPGGGTPQAVAQPVVLVGDIGVAQQMVPPASPAAPPGARGAAEGAKKNSRKFFLPTSFMSARLLTGLKAKTVASAKEDPEPMLLRIQAPAVLPNEVRAQLKGCFVIAHGFGSLASERVESRLVSLSCVDYDDRSIIEQEITGIVVDKDGVKGLAGRPVTKMGANLSRMFVAGLVEGAGEAFEQSAVTTSVSPLGQTQTIDPNQLARAGGGRGISQAAGELTKIYADLVRQSSPVIEVGPSKDVSILITQGVWLEVQEYAM